MDKATIRVDFAVNPNPEAHIRLELFGLREVLIRQYCRTEKQGQAKE
jgi:hypothetical protein